MLIMEAARLQWFRLFLVDDVRREATNAMRSDEDRAFLDEMLGDCDLLPCSSPTAEQLQGSLKQLNEQMVAKLRHVNDGPIAVAISLSAEKPTVFVSANTAHWNPAVAPLLGAQVKVASMLAFAKWVQRRAEQIQPTR
ncbi:MAG: hypothetical protein ACO1SX_20615 [Actinomycetota bacterium]